MIEFVDVHKTFPNPRGGETVAVADLNMKISAGEVHCLIGTSGCGKTTTLRMVNRLAEPTRGSIRLGGDAVAELDVIALRRRIGYVIQSGGLFPHMTVADNIGVMGRLEDWPAGRLSDRVAELLDLVNLDADTFGRRYPGELSGGQRQRVGIARALLLDPEYILMDEPFGALDPITRVQVQSEFVQLLDKVEKTVVLVTHDLSEAFALGDRISVMDGGRVLQTGDRAELLERPASEFVAEFLAAHHGVGVRR